jgi:hypothetical protein
MRVIVNVNVDFRSVAREFLRMMTKGFGELRGRQLSGGGLLEGISSP